MHDIRKDKHMGTSAQGRFIIGHDATGHWVVCDRQGMTGGLFTDRDAAMHFALTESNHAPNAVSLAPDDEVLSLWPNMDIDPVRQPMHRAA